MGAEGRAGPTRAHEDAPGAGNVGHPDDRLTRVAARLLGAPMAAITLLEGDTIRVHAPVGLSAGRCSRQGSFCEAVVAARAPLVVPDARDDPRFRQSEAVTSATGLRFYVGVPLHDASGDPIGSLCCLDTLARPVGVDPADLAALGDLAAMAAESLRQTLEIDRLADRHARLAARLRALVEAIPLPLMTIDPAGIITDWNPAAEQVFGWSAAEARGRFGPHVPPEFIGAARQLRAMDGKRLVGVESERMRRDGSRLPVAISTAPLRDAEGRPDGAVVIVEDISERRRTEREIADRTAHRDNQAALLGRIAAAMPAAGQDLSAAMGDIAVAATRGLGGCDVGVWLFDSAQQDLALSVLVDASGTPLPADSAKRHRLERLQYPLSYSTALMADRQIAAEDAMSDPRVAHLREVYIRPFGIGAMLAAPIRTGQEVLGLLSACSPGEPRPWTAEDQGFLASLADLAAVALEAGRRAQAMARLAAEKDRAEAGSRAKSLLLGTMGHELRTPLNAIIGFAELLRQEALPQAERLEFAEHVIAAGRHLLGVFNAMLDQARIESGALTLAEAQVDLPTLLDEAAGLVLPDAGSRGIRLDRQTPSPAVPPLRADAGRLRQAIANLAANAVNSPPMAGGWSSAPALMRPRASASGLPTRGPAWPPKTCRAPSSPFVSWMRGCVAAPGVPGWACRSPRPSSRPMAARWRSPPPPAREPG
ncbi:GAF domain-containing protein [Paeniroseomonas aquatica]|uniref:histidine kinase n=1 Tax=Paeniroseomonas aquatica TaxID=373043 RepID=A0ABT8A7I5_9PROT|nr:GAF domain-containing protein [Paeniroseomonas aquatica]MDN3565778.1 GAF domain-containing protein [Paeniroseomonas aquatica]